MTRNVRLVLWAAGALAVAPAVAFGPLFAAYSPAAASLAFIAVRRGLSARRVCTLRDIGLTLG
jgi:hypothetical protein